MSLRIAALLLVACGSATGPEAPPPGAPPVTTPAPAPSAMPGDHEDHDAASGMSSGEMPATLSATVAALEKHRDEIRGLVDAGKLGEVHPHTEEMEHLAVMLPVRANDLAPDDKNKVTMVATDLKASLDSVHHAADQGEAAETKAALARLDEQLAKLATYQ